MPCSVNECGRRGATGAAKGFLLGDFVTEVLGWGGRGFVGLYRVECEELPDGLRPSPARGEGKSDQLLRARSLVVAPNIGIWLTASTTANVMISMEMPSTEIAARSPLSLRS